MHLIDIVNIPSKFRDRYDQIKAVRLSKIQTEVTDTYRIFKATTDKGYITQVAFNITDEIKPMSVIKVDCTCKSFMFEFAEVIGRYNGLLLPEKYNKIYYTKRKKNVNVTLTGCKHLISLGRYILERKK